MKPNVCQRQNIVESMTFKPLFDAHLRTYLQISTN